MDKTVYVEKPWGFFRQYTHNEVSTVKIITVNPHQQLSLQSHEKRDELWVFIDEGLIAEVSEKKIRSNRNNQVFIAKGERHRLANDSDQAARILEISFGVFDENDIVRYEDRYGRV